jgi:hypothetical protein
MSRRHHGGRPHRPGGHARGPIAPSAAAPTEAPRPSAPETPIAEPAIRLERPATAEAPAPSAVAAPAAPSAVAAPGAAPVAPPMTATPLPIAYPPRHGEQRRGPDGESVGMPAGCTAPQLRRFIKSRPYVPMHELRRRFGINGQEDDVTPVDVADGRIYVGLPAREGGLLGELLRGGEVGYELSLDPRSPIVVGLYPMRPVPRS